MSNILNFRIYERVFSALVPQNSVGGLLCICGLHCPIILLVLHGGGEALTAQKCNDCRCMLWHIPNKYPNTIQRHVNNMLRNV